MKVLALVFVALVLSSTLAIQARSPSLANKKKIDNMFNNKKSWSSIIANFAFLTAKAGNPVAELLAAIEKIIADLDTKTEKATADYDARTGEHQNEIKRLTREIDNANADVANSDTFLKEVLRPMKLSLENDIARLQADIAKTKIFLEEALINRDREHNDFVTKIADIDGGLAAIKEAFGLLQQLIDGGSSFAQIQKTKSHLAKLQNVLSRNIDAALVKALVQVATSSEFTD
jgi:predicted  nucleic acid-binding Zn-ribbon protein